MATVQTLKAVCPEDKTSLTIVQSDGSTAHCICEKNHRAIVAIKNGENQVLSITFPSYEPLRTCPTENCGADLKEVVADRTATRKTNSGEEVVRVVEYKCSKGHITPHRVVIQKRYSRCK